MKNSDSTMDLVCFMLSRWSNCEDSTKRFVDLKLGTPSTPNKQLEPTTFEHSQNDQIWTLFCPNMGKFLPPAHPPATQNKASSLAPPAAASTSFRT